MYIYIYIVFIYKKKKKLLQFTLSIIYNSKIQARTHCAGVEE